MLSRRMTVSDLAMLEIIHDGFWLGLFIAVVLAFRPEIRRLLQSVAGFKVAGAAFEFSDKKETVESYALLADTFIGMLSGYQPIDPLLPFFPPAQAENLGRFALKYTTQVPSEDWNEALLRNIGYVLIYCRRYGQGAELFTKLLARLPNNSDFLNLKALALLNSRVPESISEAEPILRGIVERYPETPLYRFNFALALSLLGRDEEATTEMITTINTGYLTMFPNYDVTAEPLFHHTRDKRPDLMDKIRAQLRPQTVIQGPISATSDVATTQ
jgi:tetratricopeptide (TPR) repeat protein